MKLQPKLVPVVCPRCHRELTKGVIIGAAVLCRSCGLWVKAEGAHRIQSDVKTVHLRDLRGHKKGQPVQGELDLFAQ
jgi:hypothetical protein